MIDGRFELGDALSRGAKIAKVFALASLRLVGAREGIVGHRLVARGLSA